MTKLTEKQESFAQKYIETGNASEAYRQVYSCKSKSKNAVHVRASELLANSKVAVRVKELKSIHQDRHIVTVDRVIEELSKLAFYNAGNFFKWGPDGVKIIDQSELTPDQLAVVQSASETVTQHGGTIRVNLPDKLKALELLGRTLGMFADNINVTNFEAGQAEQGAIQARKQLKFIHGQDST